MDLSISELEAEIHLAERLDTNVLISGERGVGIEDVAYIASLVHGRSRRSCGPFVTVRCGGSSDALLDAELSGKLYTSPSEEAAGRRGPLDQADGGSLLLQEVGEIGEGPQETLLRFLDTRLIRYPGRSPRVVDVRVIATTTQPLYELVVASKFREDLFYHLNVIHLGIPPLCDRREHIPSLVGEIVHDLNARDGITARQIGSAVMTSLQAYDWPGNLRELRDVVGSLLVGAQGDVIEPDDLPPAITGRLQQRAKRT
jgi:DNA-binding NtrC family response regulator